MKKVFAVLLVLLLLFSTTLTAFADGGVEEDVEDYRFIGVFYMNGEKPVEDYVYADRTVHNDVFEGITYDKAANTLTLNSVNAPDLRLTFGSMGDDFKMIVNGNCSLLSITCTAFGDVSSLTIDGSGTLIVNEQQEDVTPICFMFTMSEKCRLVFGENVTVKLYGDTNTVAMYETGWKTVDGAILFNAPHSAEPVIRSFEDKGKEFVFINGYFENTMSSKRGEFLGYRVINPADPNGVYTASHYETTNQYGEVTGEGYAVNHYLWSDALGMYFYDLAFNPSSSDGAQYLTLEEYTQAGYESLLGEYQEPIALYNPKFMRTGWNYSIFQDESGNRYAVGEEYDSEVNDLYTAVAEFEPIPDIEGQYIFTPSDVDDSDLTYVSGEALISGFYIRSEGGYRYILGDQVIHPDDPDGLYYVADKSPLYDDSTGDFIGYEIVICRAVYLEDVGVYIGDQSSQFTVSGEEFDERGFRYATGDTGANVELSYYVNVEHQDQMKVYSDGEGGRYAEYNYNSVSYFFTFAPIDGLEDAYWLTPAEGVDIENLTEEGEEILYGVYHTVYIEGNYFEYGKNLGIQKKYGDADGDGDVTILDATAIQRQLAGLPTKSYDEQAADVDGDTGVSIVDATAIQRFLAGFNDNHPIGEFINA